MTPYHFLKKVLKREHRANESSFRGSGKGFTLIETLVAISVILLALVGPLSIAAQALSAAYYARDQITAFYLAQEGVEYVRAVRDQNFLDGNSATGWLFGLSGCIDSSCEIDVPSFNHAACSGPCNPVKESDTSGLFNKSQGAPSIYTRSVRLETVPDHPDEVLIRVTISWTSAGINRTYEVFEQLFDWL